jgi:ribose transport system substrate-binding protein
VANELWTRRDFVKRAGRTAGAVAFGLAAGDILAACAAQVANSVAPGSPAPASAAPSQGAAASAASAAPSFTQVTDYPSRPKIVNNFADRPDEGPMLLESVMPKRPYLIAYSYPVFDNTFFTALQYGIENEVRRANVSLITTFGSGYNHPEKQIKDMEDLIAQKPDGIVCNQADEAALRPIMDRAADLGIVVSTHVSSPSKKYSGWAGVSHYDGGVEMTRLFIEAMGAQGKAIALDGPKGQPFSDEPEAARNDLLPHESNIQIVAQQYTDTSRTQTTEIFETLYRANPDIQGVWETFADPAVAVCLALKNLGKNPGDIKVVSKGWVADAKTWIEQGWLYGTTLQQDVLTGQQAIRLQIALLNGEKPPFHVLVPALPLTKETIGSTDFSVAEAPAGFTPTARITAS